MNFAKFLSSVLRTHKSDCLEFELAVERSVWDMVQHDFMKVIYITSKKVFTFRHPFLYSALLRENFAQSQFPNLVKIESLKILKLSLTLGS